LSWEGWIRREVDGSFSGIVMSLKAWKGVVVDLRRFKSIIEQF
jgi:hypothetical protein